MREYQSFNELVEKNQSLFKRIVDQGDIELMEACWQARDPEIHRYQKISLHLERQLKDLKNELEETKKGLHKSTESSSGLKTELENLHSSREALSKNLDDSKKNIQSLENFNQELLKANNDLQDDVAKLEELLSAKEDEFTDLSTEIEKERLENNIEVKNAKEAIQYADELEELQEKNLKYVSELEARLQKAETDKERALKLMKDLKDRNNVLEKERITINQSIKLENENRKKLEHRYKFSVEQNRELEIKSKELVSKITSLNGSNAQKAENIKQLQTTLALKTKMLNERDTEYQKIENKIKNQSQIIVTLEEEIELLEKSLDETLENQKALEDYAEKLKVTTERELIKRKELETKQEASKLKISLLISEKENTEAKLLALEETFGKIRNQLGSRKSNIRPSNHQLQMDN